MQSNTEALLENEGILNVLWIYFNDLKDIFFGAILAIYQLISIMIRSTIMKILKFPETIAEASVLEFKHIFNTEPIPDDFDYSFLTVYETVGLPERRFCAFLLSFVIGAGTHLLYLRWQQPVLPQPPYYSSTIIALVVEFICPKVGKNRQKFLLYPIGSATLFCLAYGIFNKQMDFIYLFSTAVAIGFTYVNLQALLGNSGRRNDYATAYHHIALPINSMYNELICILLFGNYIPNRALYEAIPDALEEQYTIMVH
ncbi:unnamed protein product [Thelazia callipaeda]|uniref:Uncharacterized protein n=1 Tax=Thelazia callipaeda TaxID=103827 RepID=A0A158RAS3_THECL|nr:unnamed protein product [Thelazia callipaeda]